MSIAQTSATDPTRTVTFRREFVQHFNSLWEDIRGRVREQIEGTDRLGQSGRFGTPQSHSTAARLQEFSTWFDDLLEERVFQSVEPRRVRHGQHWTAGRVREAYERGLRRADQLLRNAEADYSDALSTLAPPASALTASHHQDVLRDQYIAAYHDLQEVIDKTRNDVRRTLREKLEQDASKRETANALTTRVDKVGQTGTKRLVQGTTIIGVNKAALQRYRAAGVDKVGAQVEVSIRGPMTDRPELARQGVPASERSVQWQTAGDRNVCEQCASLEGRTWKVSEYADGGGVLPVRDTHISCRCLLTPA